MARLVMILGKSSSGKSTSLRNFTKDEINVISVLGKELPFRTDIVSYRPKSYDDVVAAIEKASKPVVVIDDANYLMSLYEFATINEQGYGKFVRNAQSMVKVFNTIREKDSDQTFYVMAHLDQAEDGHIEFKTTGKMVSEKYNPQGVTNIVLKAEYDAEREQFAFRVKADGLGVKSPLDMFTEATVPNDLKEVDKIIREYFKPIKEGTK